MDDALVGDFVGLTVGGTLSTTVGVILGFKVGTVEKEIDGNEVVADERSSLDTRLGI